MRYRLLTSPRRATYLALLLLSAGSQLGAGEAPGDKPSKPAPAGIHGRVYTNDENTKALRLVPGARIELLQGGKTIGQATSDRFGYYSIHPLAPGSAYYFHVSARGYKDEHSGRGFNLHLTEGDAVVNFTLQKGTTDPSAKPPELPKVTLGHLRGQIYEKTPDGELHGVNGATVYLCKDGSREVVTVVANAPTPGQDKSGYLCDLEAGKWQVIALASGFDALAPVVVVVPADQMAVADLVLTRPDSGGGGLTRPKTDDSGGGGLTRPKTDDSGGGGLTRPKTDDSGGGGLTRPKEPEPKYQGLQGTITLAGASPGNAPPIEVNIYTGDTHAPVQLDAQGNYKVDCPPGRYVVEAKADGYLPKRSAISDVLSGGYTVVNLKLERRPAELLVYVFSAETKQPLGPANLSLRRPTDPLSMATTQKTDAAGHCTFTPTPAGDYQVLARLPGYKPAGKDVQVRAGDTSTVELYLIREDKPAELTVHVVDSYSREDLAKVSIHMTRVGEDASDCLTDAKGYASVTLPKACKVVLSVKKTGYIAQERPVTLVAGENTQTFLLIHEKPPAPTLNLFVIDSQKGTPLPGVSLNFSPNIPNEAGLKTDAQGHFDGKLPAPGPYKLEMTCKGYQTRTESLTVSAGYNTRRLQLDPVETRLVVEVVQAGRPGGAIPGVKVRAKSFSAGPFFAGALIWARG